MVSREELRPSSSPNIEQVELQGGQLIVFNSALGWYDAEHAYIEGVDMLGSRDTIPLSQVKRAQVSVAHTNPFLDVLLGVLVIGIIAGIASMVYLFELFTRNGGGCLVLLAVLSTGMLTTVAILIL